MKQARGRGVDHLHSIGIDRAAVDVGESVEVVSEDGSKTSAPDGEHEISLRDSEGNEVLIKIFTKDGVITERENVELEKTMDEEVVDKEAAVLVEYVPASQAIQVEINEAVVSREYVPAGHVLHLALKVLNSSWYEPSSHSCGWSAPSRQ